MAKLTDRAACIVFCKKGENLYIPLVKYTFKEVYDIPRGGFDEKQDRSLIQTVIRELKEELSLDLSRSKFYKVGQYEEWHRNTKSGVMLHYVIHSFVTTYPKTVKLKPQIKDEIESANWYTYEQAIKLLYQTKNLEPIKQIFKAHLIALRYKLI